LATADDLTEAHDRAAILHSITQGIDGVSDGRAKNFAAQLWALRDRMAVGDLVVMPLKTSPHLTIGHIASDYRYVPEPPDRAKRHRRAVDWIAPEIPRTLVRQDLLYSLGAFSTICEISRNDPSWRFGELMRGNQDPGVRTTPPITTKTTDVGDEASDTTQSDVEIGTYARDQISTRVFERFTGHRMADLTAEILTAHGYECDVSPPGADRGVDIIAGTGLLGLTPPRIVAQVKSEAGAVGLPVVQQLQGAIATHGADHGLLVGWGGITRDARRYLSTHRFKIKIWDSQEVLDNLFTAYDRLSAEVQRDIPLKRIWAIAEETGGD
jgi:restriction system protein